MVAIWFCEINGEQQGPLSTEQLRKLAASGKLQAHHLLWKEGMQKKVPARAIKGLLDGSGPSRAVPAASASAGNKGGEIVAAELVEEVAEGELIEEVTAETVEEVVEVVEAAEAPEEQPAAKKSRKDSDHPPQETPSKPAPEVLTEASITYRKGMPGRTGPLVGTLYVESTGLRFEFEDDEFRISFQRLEDVMAPTEGDHPPGSAAKALGTKVAGKLGKIASGMMGSMVGGMLGSAAKKAGEEASKMVEESGELGQAPKNRITLLVRLRSKHSRVYFDVNGADRREMNNEAQMLFRRLQKARRAAAAATAEEEEVPVSVAEDDDDTPPTPPAATSAALSGQQFRVQRAGKILGTYSFNELRRLLGAGQLTATDLIAIEAWIPVSSLGGLLLAGSASSSSSNAPTPTPTSGGGVEKAAEPVKAATSDEGLIAVDKEFEL